MNDRVWLPPIEWKSLKQWWEFLDQVTLLKPELECGQPPDGWLEMPADIKVHRLCHHEDRPIARRLDTLRAARALLSSTHVLMARMPYYETTWCYRVARNIGTDYFVEIHGDWETAVLEEDSKSLSHRITRRFRAWANRRALAQMTENALCVLAVGPRLVEKYVPASVPSLISTNHLLSEREYSPRIDFALRDPPRILFVGDMQRRKGLHFLFHALASLNDQGRRFEMVMVGSGPMVGELNAYASRRGFADRVTFVGKVAHGDVIYNHYRSSDVFVLPSVAAEGVPRVTHEAMAFGCPVIATDIGSVSWQLEGGAGIVIPPGNVESLARAISRVLDDADLRRTLSKTGFRRSLDYTYEKQKARIAEFVRTHLQI